jgi:predicted kinase
MCGLPRCGKSTWIKENKGDAIVISSDEVRAQIFGHQYHFPAEGFVWAVVHSMARMLLDQGKSILVDETGLTNKIRHQWRKFSLEYGVPLHIVWVQTELKECLRRNEQSTEGVDKLPNGIIEQKASYFEEPVEDAQLDPPVFVLTVNEHDRSYGQQLVEDFGWTPEEAFRGHTHEHI